jgi:hypothetical protein
VKHFILCIGVAVFHVKQFHGRTRITKTVPNLHTTKTVPKHFYESLTHSKNRAKVRRQMLKNGKGDP